MSAKQRIWQNLNLSQLSGLLAALLVLLTGLFISLLSYSHLYEQLQQRTQQDIGRQLQRLTLTLAPSLLRQDRVSLNVTLTEWARGPEIDAIRVLNANRDVLAEIGRATEHSIEISQSITQDLLAIGILRADVNYQTAKHMAQRYLAFGLMASSFCALLAALLVYALTERYLGYLRKLRPLLQQWQQDTQQALELPKAPVLAELQELHQTLTHISEQQSQQLAINAAVSRFSAAQLSASTGEALRYHDCALLFIEIHNLHELQSRLSADQLTSILNRYHRLLSHAAKLYNGKLDRYIGNGVVMLFGMNSDDHSRNQALHCLYAAQLFLGLIRHVRDNDPSSEAVQFRMAAHWGPVLLSSTNANNPNQYDLIGDTLHWSAHLASHNERAQLLVSQALHEHLPEMNNLTWKNGPLISDLHGQEQASFWLEQLSDKQQLLIQRQIRHLTMLAENTE